MAIDMALEGKVDAEVVEKLTALKEQLAKRGSGKHGPTKTQREGLELMERLIEVVADADEGVTATEAGAAVGVTCQRASALLKKLVDDERVRIEKVGKQVRFFLA
jgi:hypothetical protein